MKFERLVVLVTSVACVAGVQPGMRVGVLASTLARSSDTQRVLSQGISGKVLRFDRQTTVPDHPVQLRNVNKKTIVGRTVSDRNGEFSFAVTEPGLYVVEAVKGGGIEAIGSPVTFANLPITSDVILPPKILTTLAALAIATAGGVMGWAVATDGPTSPER